MIFSSEEFEKKLMNDIMCVLKEIRQQVLCDNIGHSFRKGYIEAESRARLIMHYIDNSDTKVQLKATLYAISKVLINIDNIPLKESNK